MNRPSDAPGKRGGDSIKIGTVIGAATILLSGLGFLATNVFATKSECQSRAVELERGRTTIVGDVRERISQVDAKVSVLAETVRSIDRRQESDSENLRRLLRSRGIPARGARGEEIDP